ncbi:hypothetical protein E4U33_003987 [Claviceps sp. LM78 group G4]|nr:hypothetical protein E4U33_003987 [Claviceps sp. LM78 group G4]
MDFSLNVPLHVDPAVGHPTHLRLAHRRSLVGGLTSYRRGKLQAAEARPLRDEFVFENRLTITFTDSEHAKQAGKRMKAASNIGSSRYNIDTDATITTNTNINRTSIINIRIINNKIINNKIINNKIINNKIINNKIINNKIITTRPLSCKISITQTSINHMKIT